MPAPDLIAEAARQMTVCNACRYCEGYCAVFPAMERRTRFDAADIVYLANLCHDCRDCLYACQYAPPHEFAINVPRVLSEVRVETYRDYTWPARLRRVFTSNLSWSATISLACVAIVFVLLLAIGPAARLLQVHPEPGSFYLIAPYVALVIGPSILVLYAAVVFARGVVRFSSDIGSGDRSFGALWQAVRDTLDLRYLKGGGAGCQYPTEQHSTIRRTFHGLVFYGFLADVASTCAAAIEQDIFDILPPYPLLSVPVVLGTLGGAAIVIGVVGLLTLKQRADPEANTQRMVNMDIAFLLVLGLVALSGLLLLVLRDSALMGVLLALHLGLVASLFVTAPYGKFAHVIYRFAALARNAAEAAGRPETKNPTPAKRRPN